LRRVLEDFERKHEIAVLENEKFKMKLPKMERMLSQKAQDFEEANCQSSVKIEHIQQEASKSSANLKQKKTKKELVCVFTSDNFAG
jgi:hypothetical protein